MLRLLVALLAVPAIGLAAAKPEQIRSDSDPVFHLYLQSHPQNGGLPSLLISGVP